MKLSSSTSVGGLEAGIEIAERPLLERLAHRQPSRFAFVISEVGGRPFHGFGDWRWSRTLGPGRWWTRCAPDVAVQPRVGAARPEAVERIDDEGKRLEIHLDRFDGQCRGLFVDGRDGQDRLAGIERLVGQRLLGAVQIRYLVGGEDGSDAGNGERGAGVDAAHARVRHRAEQQFREEHAVGAEVLGVLRASGHLGEVIGRDVVRANQLPIRHWTVPACSPRPSSAR